MRELTGIEVTEISGSGFGEFSTVVVFGAIGAGAAFLYSMGNLAQSSYMLEQICLQGGGVLEACKSNLTALFQPMLEPFVYSGIALGAGIGIAAGAGFVWALQK